MSDFNFMKSGLDGFGNDDNTYNKEIDDIINDILDYHKTLFSLFIAKSTQIGSRYCVLAKRSTLTQKDMEYALKFQAIEFFKNKNLPKELSYMKTKLDILTAKDTGEFGDAKDTGEFGDAKDTGEFGDAKDTGEFGDAKDTGDNKTDIVISDAIQIAHCMIEPQYSDADLEDEEEDEEVDLEDEELEIVKEDEEPFTRAELKNIDGYDDMIFIKKMHHYYEYWPNWEPENDFEYMIKRSINEITQKL